jgi:hypothetical protein
MSTPSELREAIESIQVISPDNDYPGDIPITHVLSPDKIDAILDAVIASLHDSIMRSELKWPNVREDAWLNATIHRWLDVNLQSAKSKESE